MMELTWLTGRTVTDEMICVLRDDARREARPQLETACEKALRFPTTIRTLDDAAQRLAARTACANEINDRARGWLEHGAVHPIAWARYAELVQAHAPAAAEVTPATAELGGVELELSRDPNRNGSGDAGAVAIALNASK